MQKKMQRLAASYIAQNHRHRVWKKIVSVLACIVVFCTTYALILPAITMESPTLYCGLDEHTHGESCYEKNITCAAESDASHTHTDECYQTVLACGKEEHAHALVCSSNPKADIESAEDWQNSVAGAVLTGNRHKDLIAVAESQLGYTESDRNFAVGEDGATKHGYTRYGAWSGDPYGDWSTMFVSFCLSYAGIPAEAFPTDKSCAAWVDALKNAEKDLYREKDKYVPKAGDLIFYDADGDKTADSVGLVTEITDATEIAPIMLRAIEGNSDNCVKYVDYSIEDAGIVGYGSLPYEPRVEYIWRGDGMEVRAYFSQNAEIPENAALVVKPLLPEDLGDAYGNRYAASQAKIAEINAAEITKFDLFKICLEADGKEVLSGEDATVEIRFPKAESNDKTCTELYRYSADGTVSRDHNLREENGSLIGSFDAALSGEYAIVLADVVQTLAGENTETGTDMADETVLTPHKYIDALRDGFENQDTQLHSSVDKTDLYRLYLDAEMSMVNKPIDLLIVVDQSGSMHNDYQAPYGNDMTKENGANAYRDEALRLVLNGYSGTNSNDYDKYKQNGLIYQFLNANTDNRVCVVGFQGNGNNYHYGSNYEFQMDSNGQLADVTDGWLDVKETNGNTTNHTGDIHMNVFSGIVDEYGYLEAQTFFDWTHDPQFVDVRGVYGNATNYTAGFIQAQRAMDRLNTLDANGKDSNRQRIVLFLSDGKPTCYIAEGTKRVIEDWNWVNKPYYYREGDGSNDDTKGTDTATDTAFENFMKANEDVILSTVSIYGGTALTRLESMATRGKGDCYSATTTDDLENNLKKLMFGALYTELTIKDTLSRYVDIYEEQPDYKVTLKKPDGSVITLWENGGITPDGEGIIKSVKLDPTNKKLVTAEFEPTYLATPGTTVTLSFNIKTNQLAYQEYSKMGYSNNTGQKDTDYNDHINGAESRGNKSTSSGQPGFNSNSQAVVSYKKNGEIKEKTYPHPVVQVAACKVAVQKTDKNNGTQLLPGAQFTLYRKPFDGEGASTVLVELEINGVEDKYVEVGKLADVEGGTPGQYVAGNLIPNTDYWLVETQAPAGYMQLEAPVHFKPTRGTNGEGKIEGSEHTVTISNADGTNETLPLLQVPNTPWGHELPSTGGDGTVAYTVGGALLITAALLLMYQKKRRGKGDMTCS